MLHQMGKSRPHKEWGHGNRGVGQMEAAEHKNGNRVKNEEPKQEPQKRPRTKRKKSA